METEIAKLERNGFYLIIDPGRPHWFSTNRAGLDVLSRLKGKTVAELAIELGDLWGIPPGRALKEAERFLEQLREIDFVSSKPRVSYKGRGASIAPERLEEIFIFLTNRCHLRCKHCYVSAGDFLVAEMSTLELKHLIDEACALGVGRIHFTGGEPFLRSDIYELIEYVTRVKRIQLVILTTANFFTPGSEYLRKLKKVYTENLILQVSLDGPNPEIHDAIRGEGNFKLSISGIKTLVNNGIVPITTTAIMKNNRYHIVETLELVASLGIRVMHVLWPHEMGRMLKFMQELQFPISEILAIMRKLREKSRELGTVIVDNEMSFTLGSRAKRGMKKDLCNCCYTILDVDSDGHVYPCVWLNGVKRFDCGSIKEEPLREIWLNSQVMRAVRHCSVKNIAECQGCPVEFMCGGGYFCLLPVEEDRVDGELRYRVGQDPYHPAYLEMFKEALWRLGNPSNEILSSEDFEPPKIYAWMDEMAPVGAEFGTRRLIPEVEVGHQHCACVLAVQVGAGGDPYSVSCLPIPRYQ